MLKYLICCLVVLSACDDGYPLKVTVNAPAGIDGANGMDGINGTDGADGADGKDGSSCSVEQIVGGALINCTDGTMAVVLDGVDGQNGQDGLSFLIGYEDPCGDQSGIDEIIFYDADGSFYAWYTGVGLVKLDENVTYQTTDAHKARFKIVAGELIDVSC